MQIRRVEISQYRGIRSLDWTVDGTFVCLIGPGDATKTTILDAIELALSPRWSVNIDDSDFYNVTTAHPIKITVTVGELPEAVMRADKFGMYVRGWTRDGSIRDEAEDEDEHVLSIRVRVEADLEPQWTVVCDRLEGKPIFARDREALGVARLGAFVDRHFTYSRGSMLVREAGDVDDLSGILADAARHARADIPREKAPILYDAAERASRTAKTAGVASGGAYVPRLDVQAIALGLGAIAIHDGAVPLRRAGLGTRRLLALALQREQVLAGGIALIDEIELGLEPHRIHRLLEHLRKARKEGEGTQCGQTVLTTHSPVVIRNLDVGQVRIVRTDGGLTTVTRPSDDLQGLLRSVPSALLGRKIIACEGKTELGLVRALDRHWAKSLLPLATLGVAPADGGGTPSPETSEDW